jgi:uncharacterized membrane protein
MELSPEERKRIYEEEKARLEAEKKAEQERRAPAYDTSTGLVPNVEGLLCYLGIWVTGLVFFILEQKNNWARFHAAQSLIFFGALAVFSIIIGWIPFIGGPIVAIIWTIGFIFWIVLMVKAYQGERYMLPVVGEIAERMVTTAGQAPETYRYTPPPAPPASVVVEAPPAARAQPLAEAPPPHLEGPSLARKRAESHRRQRREARIAGSVVAIAWFIVLLIFFNFFYEYAAYYTAQTANGVTAWTHQSFFTGEISRWLPILNVTLGIAIVGHIMLMFVEHNLIRRSIRIVMDGLGLATVITLLAVYPFDFNVIPNNDAAAIAQLSVTVVLILIAVGLGVSLIVRFIRLLIGLVRTLAGPED